jgi:hypothetical protein
VRAHLFVASLAFLLDRALEKKLKAAGLDISPNHGRLTARLGLAAPPTPGAKHTTTPITPTTCCGNHIRIIIKCVLRNGRRDSVCSRVMRVIMADGS